MSEKVRDEHDEKNAIVHGANLLPRCLINVAFLSGIPDPYKADGPIEVARSKNRRKQK
jgi:hypothetical protein